MSTACVTDDNRPKVAKNCADNTELSSLSEVNTKFAYSPHCTEVKTALVETPLCKDLNKSQCVRSKIVT